MCNPATAIRLSGGAAVKVERIFVPDRAKRAYYEDLFALYKESYQALESVNADFQQASRLTLP